MSGSGRLPFSLEKTRAGSSFQPFRSFWASLRTNHARKVFVSCCERSTRRPLPLFGVVRLPSFQAVQIAPSTSNNTLPPRWTWATASRKAVSG